MAKRLVIGTNDLESVRPDLLIEWHDDNPSPSTVGIFSSQHFYWICKVGHKYLSSPRNRNRGRGCNICAGKIVFRGVNDLQTSHSKLAEQWSAQNELQACEVMAGSSKKYYWTCGTHGDWLATPNNRTKNNTGCPKCSGNVVDTGNTDLASKYPNLALEWDEDNNNFTPAEVSCGSMYIAYWTCGFCNHQWQARVQDRAGANKSGCPNCWAKSVRSKMEEELYNWVVKELSNESI